MADYQLLPGQVEVVNAHLDDVLESLRERATCSCSLATLARRESISACRGFHCVRKRLQLSQLAFLVMERNYMRTCAGGQTSDDVELRLRENLDGLDWILPQLSGNPPGPRPKYRTR
jgi:hypothetical protein